MVEYDNLQIYWIDLGWVYHQIYPQIYHHDMGNKIIPKYDIYIYVYVMMMILQWYTIGYKDEVYDIQVEYDHPLCG